MSRVQRGIFAFTVLLLVIGGVGSVLAKEGLQQDENGNFILYVSNQTDAVDPVDIKIYIDGKKAVDQDFYFGSYPDEIPAHNWQKFQFSLLKGSHQLRVESDKGSARLEKEFEIKDRHWAVIDYWYSPVESKDGLRPRQFTFEIKDKPFSFY